MKWEEISSLLAQSANPIQLEESDASSPAAQLGIPEESALGQILRHVGSLTVSGYFRLHSRDIPAVTEAVTRLYPGKKTVVATDVWGGIFAIGNGDFPGDPEIIWYHAPDTLQWETMRIGYPKFLKWMCSRRFPEYHSAFVWENMDALVQALTPDQGILPEPPLWVRSEARTAWRVVPFCQLLETVYRQEQT